MKKIQPAYLLRVAPQGALLSVESPRSLFSVDGPPFTIFTSKKLEKKLLSRVLSGLKDFCVYLSYSKIYMDGCLGSGARRVWAIHVYDLPFKSMIVDKQTADPIAAENQITSSDNA